MTTLDNFDQLSREKLIELLRAESSGSLKLSFEGKDQIKSLARKVRPRVVKDIKKYSVGSAEARARNLVLEGDNLQGMATLHREHGSVDLILTDPPYNTGNDWRYNDRWEEDPNDDGLGDWVTPEDGGRHTKWVKFMWPRLQMMKSMLKPGGVLAICIDHRELFRLGIMLDELFGENNRLAILNWQKSYSPRGDNRHVSTATEYVLVYARDESRTKTGLLPRTEAMDQRYLSPDGDHLLWKPGDASGPKAKTHKKMVYGIQSPFTGEYHYPPVGKCWRPEQKDVLKYLQDWGCKFKLQDLNDKSERARIIGVPEDEVPDVKGIVVDEDLEVAAKAASQVLENGPWPRVFFGKSGTGRPQLKRYLEDVKQGKVPMTWFGDEDYDPAEVFDAMAWPHQESGHSQTGISELNAIVGDSHGFETVKPLKLFRKIIHLWCPESGLVLDPFSGSGTTGHAVLWTNFELGTERRFILIEQGRPDGSDGFARSLTADRVKRAITGNWTKGKAEALGGGFRFSTLKKKVDAETLLAMERDEMTDTVIASHFDTTRRNGTHLIREDTKAWRYLVARNDRGEGFFLVWDGPGANTDLTEDVYRAISEEAQDAGLASKYHVYARLYLFQTDTVTFYQIPDQILADFGVDVRHEPYSEQ